MTRLCLKSIGVFIEAVLDDDVLFKSIGVLIEAVLDDEVLFKFKLPVLHDEVSKSCKDKPSSP